jgi:hypothetical protein
MGVGLDKERETVENMKRSSSLLAIRKHKLK